jgi:hypothetical protein
VVRPHPWLSHDVFSANSGVSKLNELFIAHVPQLNHIGCCFSQSELQTFLPTPVSRAILGLPSLLLTSLAGSIGYCQGRHLFWGPAPSFESLNFNLIKKLSTHLPLKCSGCRLRQACLPTSANSLEQGLQVAPLCNIFVSAAKGLNFVIIVYIFGPSSLLSDLMILN